MSEQYCSPSNLYYRRNTPILVGPVFRASIQTSKWRTMSATISLTHSRADMPIIDHNDVPEVPWRPGYRKWDVTLKEHGVSTSLSLNTAEPGTGAPLHTHEIDELIMIMEGTLEVRINGETHTVEQDHTVVIPPGAEHAFKVVGEKTARLIVVFPHMDPYSPENTTYLEGSRPA